MHKAPRKATDVLLDLESKIENLIHIIRSQDLNIKLLSNKLNLIIEQLDKKQEQNNKITVEAVVDTTSPAYHSEEQEKNIPVLSDFNMSVDNNPQGFRRTSRPETYAGDNSYLAKDEKIFPIQMPKIQNIEPEIRVNIPESEDSNPKQNNNISPNGIPVLQRVVDRNGKSVFLADVEIIGSDGNFVSKTRTNGTGKWMASLPSGSYKIIIRKRESLTKEKLESTQSITVDGTKSPFELQTMIIR
jgi:hypothetical protein